MTWHKTKFTSFAIKRLIAQGKSFLKAKMMDLVSVIGSFTLLYLAIKAVHFLYRRFLHFGRVSNYAPAGSWAIVTGCTGGIGEGFANVLAKSHVNLILVSRSLSKLNDLKSNLEKKHPGIKIKVVDIDFAATPEDMSKLKDALADVEKVRVLVNNVGVNSEMPGKYLEIPEQEIRDMINVNITGTLAVTRAVLPKMIEGKKGLIVNLGSYTSVVPTPLLGVYGGTKAFVDVWSQTLRAEYSKEGIEVVSLYPMYVVSAMSGFRKPTLTVCSPEKLAADTFASIGGLASPPILSPYLPHAIVTFLYGLIPTSIYNWVAGDAMKAVRKKKLQKKQPTTVTDKKAE